jgi:hypothetical protein
VSQRHPGDPILIGIRFEPWKRPTSHLNLFHEGLNRIEVSCDSRKVGDIRPRRNGVSDSGVIRGCQALSSAKNGDLCDHIRAAASSSE